LFYLITNSISWLVNPFGNPEYTRTLGGWLRALTLGTAGWPETWHFFRNTMLSSGLFTFLFAGSLKLTAPAEDRQKEEEPEGAEVVAIDLGTRTTKAVYIQRKGDSYQFLRYAVMDSPTGEKGVTREALTEHLKNVTRALEPRTKQVTLAIGVGDSLLRNTDLP